MTALTARIRFFICGFAIFAAVIILHSRRTMTGCVRAFIGHIHEMPFQFPFSYEYAKRLECGAFGAALIALSSKGLKAFTAATVTSRFPCVYYHGDCQSGAERTALQTLRVFKRELYLRTGFIALSEMPNQARQERHKPRRNEEHEKK